MSVIGSAHCCSQVEKCLKRRSQSRDKMGITNNLQCVHKNQNYCQGRKIITRFGFDTDHSTKYPWRHTAQKTIGNNNQEENNKTKKNN